MYQCKMPNRNALEIELAALTEEFVARIVGVLRNASFADVASLAPAQARAPERRRVVATPDKRTRRGPNERAELADRVAETLRRAGEPLGVRALASELGVAPDKLAGPLKELRDAGRVKKHGDKRSTTYSAS